MKILIYILPFIWSIGLSQTYYKPLNLGIKDGFPSETIRYIFKDSKGNIWYGTDAGVVRHNGEKLTQYSSRDGLAGDKVWTIDEDQQGNIWFGCYGSGLSKFDGNQFTNYKNEEHDALNNIRRIFVAKEGSIFAGSDIGMFRLKPNGKIKSFSQILENASHKMQGGGFYQFHEDTVLYVTIGKGECFYHLKEDTIFSIPENHKYAKTRGYIAKEINDELVVAGGGIKIFKDDTIIIHRLGEYGLNGPVWDVTQDGKGNYYMPAFGGGATRNFGGVYKFNGVKIEDISSHMNIMGSNFWSILYDIDYDILHIGSLESGIYLLKNDAFSYADITLSPNVKTDIAIDVKNNKWLYTSKKIIRVNGTDTINYWDPLAKSAFESELNYIRYQIEVFSNPNADSSWCENHLKVSHYPYRNLYVHPRLGAQAKGSLYKPDLEYRLRSTLSNPKEYFNNTFQEKFSIISVVPDINENIWISTSKGLLKVDSADYISAYHMSCASIYVDRHNTLWNTPQYQATKKIPDLSNPYKSIDLVKTHKNAPKDVISYAETLKELFFASWNSGMYVYKREYDKFLNLSTTNSTLTSNQYKSVIAISDTAVIGLQTNGSFQLFESTGDSVLSFEVEELSEYFKGKTISDVVTSGNQLAVITSDGLYLMELDNIRKSPINTSFLDKEEGFELKGFGYFYFSPNKDERNIIIYSSNELVELNLKRINEIIEKQDFKFQIENVFVNDELHHSIAAIEMEYNENNIKVVLEAENFINPRKDLFRYKIDGGNQGWSDWSNNNQIQLTNLHYGNYKLIFQHKNRIASEAISTLELQFIIHPPWWETTWFYSLSVLSFGLLIYLFNWKRLRVIKKRQKELEYKIKEATAEIKFQRDEISEQNREIKDSIQYAKRIQSAILPPIALFHQKLNKSFVYYLPKDIVAGDFYWIGEQNDTTLFAACDCTGHGVPGAMVSVVCNNGLNRSVREYRLSDPGEILNKTRDIVLQEFEKSDEEVKDGMDVALCALKDNSLSYAGAHNPLWIIRSGAKEIEEIKANKQPIGKYDDSKPFTTHHIELKTGDTIYIFSDGYADQFGGTKGKKFKSTNFKKLLLSIQSESMEKQLDLINQTFEEYKGDLEQLDDICIIGVRL